MPNFIKGGELNRLFYEELVGPILRTHLGYIRHTACLIGYGSDVLGFDTEESTDHEWGPKFQLFLSDDDWSQHRDRIDELLSVELPRTFRGFSTSFSEPDEFGVRVPADAGDGPIRHGVDLSTLERFLGGFLHTDPLREPTTTEWLTFSEQSLLMITQAPVYWDDLGLAGLQAKFHYYPRDVWLYLLASQWHRIDQMEPFMGRSGSVGDELGSRLIAHQIALDLVRLCFLMEKRYAPYAKWLGSAFRELNCAPRMAPILSAILSSGEWKEREDHLSKAYELTARMHNSLHITDPLDTGVRPFYNRPFLVIEAGRFARAISAQIVDPEVRGLPYCLGSIDQISHSVDVLTTPSRRQALQRLYEP